MASFSRFMLCLALVGCSGAGATVAGLTTTSEDAGALPGPDDEDDASSADEDDASSVDPIVDASVDARRDAAKDGANDATNDAPVDAPIDAAKDVAIDAPGPIDSGNPIDAGVTCTSHASSACFASDLYWYDSCGKREELKQDCPGTCTAGACAAVTWRCIDNTASTCLCIKTADTLTYPKLSCAAAPCCFEYASTSGPTCFCGSYDAATCATYVSTYNATPRASCP